MKTHEWENWSGSVRFTPAEIAAPRRDEELAQLILRAREEGRVVRPVGAGHSSSHLVVSDDVLVSLDHFRGLESHDTDAGEATIGAGMTLKEAGETLFDVGLALHNLGDVNVQTAVGAVSTGTHGSGKRLQNLATALIGGRMVTGSGEIRELSAETMPEVIRAARCSLGGLGIFTSIRLKLLPAFKLRRQEICTSVTETLANLERLTDENRNLDFYWYPRSDEVKIRTHNDADAEEKPVGFGRVVEERDGWSHEIISKKRELKFEEMEYAMAAEAGPDCFLEIRKRILERHRKEVAWRVLYRFVAEDDAYLSTAYGRYTVTISLHHNAGLPFAPFFDDIEPIFRAYGGRPHWGKKHALRGEQLRDLYPEWDAYQRIRRQFDPDGTLLNSHLRELFALEGDAHV